MDIRKEAIFFVKVNRLCGKLVAAVLIVMICRKFGGFLWGKAVAELVISGMWSIPLMVAVVFLALGAVALCFVAVAFDLGQFFAPWLSKASTLVVSYAMAVSSVLLADVFLRGIGWFNAAQLAISLFLLTWGIWMAACAAVASKKENAFNDKSAIASVAYRLSSLAIAIVAIFGILEPSRIIIEVHCLPYTFDPEIVAEEICRDI